MSERKIPEPEASPPDRAELTRRAGLAAVLAEFAWQNDCPDVAVRFSRMARHYGTRLRREAQGEQAASRAARS